MAILECLLDLLFPPNLACAFCGNRLTGGENGICRQCEEQITFLHEPLCGLCSKPLIQGTKGGICSECCRNTTYFDFVRAAALYQGQVRHWLYQFKYGNQKGFSYPLGQLLLRTVETNIAFIRTDLIVPVPLHKERLKWRGYNQSLLLARELEKQWGKAPVAEEVLQRIHDTTPQSQLSKEQRRSNLKDAFLVNDSQKLFGKHVLLVDDIFTTGATANSCAKALKAAGAKWVGVLVVARG